MHICLVCVILIRESRFVAFDFQSKVRGSYDGIHASFSVPAFAVQYNNKCYVCVG